MELASPFRTGADYALKTLAILGGLLASLAVAAACVVAHLLLEDGNASYYDDTGVLWDVAFLLVVLLVYGTCIAPWLWRRTYVRPRISTTPGPEPSDGEVARCVGSPLFTEEEFFHGEERRIVSRPPPTWPASAFGSPVTRIQLIRTPVSPFMLPEAPPPPSSDVDPYAMPSECPTIPGGFACAPVVETPDPTIEVTGEEDADPRDFEEEPWAKA